MQQELYFDISKGESGGSLYRLPNGSFSWQHSTHDEDRDETRVFTTAYASFAAFWQMLTKDLHWYFQHPLFVHPEVRAFVGRQLESADWSVQGDFKWQQSHHRQWTKVLSDRSEYYKGK
ncbi:hypothetical protein SAMN05444008_103185 [Cnuella takakiae]|uniref:Uncharacterized protein n=1 Tax=Cnuella takakiae TaxID=1302690 RepID=A0A1M4WY04_9BACT|nr:hypothetical protein [Cnuella takakiae]OLY91584.1 hypothetical protein BUE76_06475 [Cnuella takakiae]SHE86171.1 hypothetical protein SAMN05444008_103185 [Cnuella takakiae]